MTRWFSNSSVNLKSQKFVDVSLDNIVAALNIPRDVGKPPWSRGGGGGGGGRNRRDSGYGYNRDRNYGRNYRSYDIPEPRVKRLRDDPWRRRPRGWNDWSQTGGMYSDRRGGGRDDSYDDYYRRGPNYGRAPRYSNWYNRRNRYNDEEDGEWVDEEDDQQQNYGGALYGNHWNSNRGWNNYGNNRYNSDNSGNGYNGYREQNRYRHQQRELPQQQQRQKSAFNGRSNDDESSLMDTSDGRPKGSQSALPAKKKVLNWPTLLISNLNPAVTDLDIYDLFQEFGNLKRANVHHDKYGNSLQTADVVFFSEEDARRALKEYDNTPLDGCPMRIFLCNSFTSASESTTSTKTNPVDDRRRQRENGGGDADLDDRYSDRKARNNDSGYRSGSKSANPSSMFQVNDIPKVDSNKNFNSRFSEEIKHESSKPRIPIKQGKWWHQQSRNRRSDY